MRLLSIFLSACVLLALAKAAIVALFLLFLVALIWGLCLHPREVFGFMAYCSIMGAISARPTLVISIIGLAILVGQLTKNYEQPP